MKIDLLNIWPLNNDYPAYRYTIKRYGDYFDSKYLYLSEHNQPPNIDDFTVPQMEQLGYQYVGSNKGINITMDWIQYGMLRLLKASTAPYIWYMHADFYTKDWIDLIDRIITALNRGADFVGYNLGTKHVSLQPVLFVARRESLEETSMNFSAIHERGLDHFEQISIDARELGMNIMTLEDLGYTKWVDYIHLGGETQNYIHGLSENYAFSQGEIFKIQNYWARKAPVEKNPLWMDRTGLIADRLNMLYPNVDPLDNDYIKLYHP